MESTELYTATYAQAQDEQDPLRKFRDSFVIPSKADLASKTIDKNVSSGATHEASTYLCGNSLGLQPTLTRKYFEQYLNTWAQKGVYGHFKEVQSELPAWLHADDDLRLDMANIVGAKQKEVALMQTLTANLHFLMISFYQPSKERNKILIEGHAFPSDHFAVESQIRFHGFDPQTSMVLLEPESNDSLTLSTKQILSAIDEHADDLALVLLPGIQYYTGQFFDIATITAHAQSKGIIVGWDLAHAAGNVPLKLHDWNVDFAAWCTYKYLNSGPGSIGGCFVHERHGRVTMSKESGKYEYRPRLSGWWGSQKSSRFVMANNFEPIPGAAGYQLSNTSVADSTAVRASLDIFKQTSMQEIRGKSLKVTKYLEQLLDLLAEDQTRGVGQSLFHIITPRNPEERGAQISVMLEPGLLDSVMETLEEEGVVVDERRPDVVRIAPAPLYNSHMNVLRFIQVFKKACEHAIAGRGSSGQSVMVHGGEEAKGWSEVK